VHEVFHVLFLRERLNTGCSYIHVDSSDAQLMDTSLGAIVGEGNCCLICLFFDHAILG